VGQKGPCVDAERAPQDGDTPLYNAAANGHLAVVKFLVAKGADKNETNQVREGRGLVDFRARSCAGASL